MSMSIAPQNRTETPQAQPLVCGERRRPPLGTSPAAVSHRDLRDRLLRCAG
jgi:hypothetical protein